MEGTFRRGDLRLVPKKDRPHCPECGKVMIPAGGGPRLRVWACWCGRIIVPGKPGYVEP